MLARLRTADSRMRWSALAVALVVVAWLALDAVMSDGYELDVVLPMADGLYDGGEVTMGGRQVGTIESIGLKGDKAIVRVDVDEEFAPLHAGTTARISWTSVVGRRTLDLLPGSEDAATLSSGKLIESTVERVELDDVLATLDEPTRRKLSSLLANLDAAISGREADINETLRTAGPTMEALGEVLRAVSEDGPALKTLVTRLQTVTSTLAKREPELRTMMADLDQLTALVSTRRESLRVAIRELPGTIDQATATLDKVPSSVEVTSDLLAAARPGVARLPAVARNLAPALQDLRPTVRDLRPTLASLSELLRYTPDVLDLADDVLPDLRDAVRTANPAVSFLRPYTPELTGWLVNWTSLFANQTSGNYARALITASLSSIDVNPGVVPPGMKQDNTPAPGTIMGQPWTDASGESIQ